MKCSKKLGAIIVAMLMFVMCAMPGAFAAVADSEILVATDKDSKAVMIQIDIPAAAGKEVSLICMDPSYSYDPATGSSNWMEFADSVCHLEQVSLDSSGKGIVQISVPEVKTGDYTVFVGTETVSLAKQFSFDSSTVTVVSDKESYEINTEILLTVTTPADAKNLTVFNENNGKIGVSIKEVEIINDNKVWNVSLSLGTKGENRVLTVRAYDSSKAEIGSGSVSFEVIRPEAMLVSVGSSESAMVSETFVVTLVTNTSVRKIDFINEYDRGIGKTLASKEVNGDRITWSYEMKLDSAGENRQIYVNLTDFDGGVLSKADSFLIDIVK